MLTHELAAAPTRRCALRGHLVRISTDRSDKLPDPSAQASRVVREPGLLTSRGPGTAFEFALAAVEELCGADVADEIAGPMVLHEGYESWR